MGNILGGVGYFTIVDAYPSALYNRWSGAEKDREYDR